MNTQVWQSSGAVSSIAARIISRVVGVPDGSMLFPFVVCLDLSIPKRQGIARIFSKCIRMDDKQLFYWAGQRVKEKREAATVLCR